MCLIMLNKIVLLLLLHYTNAGRRIFQGQDAAEGQFPYVTMWAKINKEVKENKFEFICTGSILSPSWTLSAAHCIDNTAIETGILFNVSYSPSLTAKISKVLETIAHPRYNLGDLDEGYASIYNGYDFCLLRTERIIIAQYGILSAVDYRTLIGQEVFVTGHGNTNVSSEVGTTLALKKPLQIYKGVVSHCKKNDEIDIEMAICISSLCGSLSVICGGDSGGPAIHASGVLGVHAWHTVYCGTRMDIKEINKYALAKSSSAIVAPVSNVIDWISLTIASGS